MESLERLFREHGPILVFVNVLLERLGVPIPAMPTMIVGGSAAAQGDYSVATVFALAVLASVIEAVIGIIKARRGDDDVYLMQYDEKAEQFQPIGGKREAFDVSTHAALTRELCEELALDNLKKQRTTFVIAHRLATVVSADCIVVLKDGTIIESGTHAALMAANGYYASLVKRQSRGLISNDVDPSARLDGTDYTDYSGAVPRDTG